MRIIKPTNIYPDTNRKLRHLAQRSLDKSLYITPWQYRNHKIRCRCGVIYDLPWGRPFAFEPAPLGFEDGSQFRAEGFYFNCQLCGSENRFAFPVNKEDNGYIDIFADESCRKLNKDSVLMYVYAFINFFADTKDYYKQKISVVKRKLRPGIDPENWTFHAAEIRSMSLRKKLNINLDIKEINELMIELAASLGENVSSRDITVSISGVFLDPKMPKVKDDARDQALATGLYTATDLATDNGRSVNFVLEAQNLDHQDNRIDFFVERVARSLRSSLAYNFALRGKTVNLPITKPKGIHFQLEYADLIAWSVTRYFDDCDRNAPLFFPLENLGPILWACRKSSTVEFHLTTGFDWNANYPEFAEKKQFAKLF